MSEWISVKVRNFEAMTVSDSFQIIRGYPRTAPTGFDWWIELPDPLGLVKT